MRVSPEFTRNLWLELTLHRLIGMPAVLAAIFVLTYLLAGEAGRTAVANVALILFYGLTLLWGTRQAGDAIVREINDHTWDNQRMTAISPWAMAWGKLFGSTVFPWYGGLLCLLVYVGLGGGGQESVGAQAATGVLVGLLANSVALLASLVALQKDRNLNSSLSASFMVLGLLVALPVVLVVRVDSDAIVWYGRQWQVVSFAIASLLFFCGWALLAIHRLMRHELQFRNGPAVWLAFLVVLPLYVAGFVHRDLELLPARLLAGFVTVLIMAYGLVLVEEKNPVALKRGWWAMREGRWAQSLESAPNWLVTLPLVLLFGLVLSVQQGLVVRLAGSSSPGLVPLAAGLFLLRDALLFLFFHLARNRKRADLATIFYLGVLYLLLPGMLSGFGLEGLSALLLPFVTSDGGLLSILAGAVQAGLMAALVARRFRGLAIAAPARLPGTVIDG